MNTSIRSLLFGGILVMALSVCGFAAGKKTGSLHVAVGTISSIDNSQVVINRKARGKEQPMTFKLDASTQKSGTLTTGSLVTVQYRTENNENVAAAVRERAPEPGQASAKSFSSSSKKASR